MKPSIRTLSLVTALTLFSPMVLANASSPNEMNTPEDTPAVAVDQTFERCGDGERRGKRARQGEFKPHRHGKRAMQQSSEQWSEQWIERRAQWAKTMELTPSQEITLEAIVEASRQRRELLKTFFTSLTPEQQAQFRTQMREGFEKRRQPAE